MTANTVYLFGATTVAKIKTLGIKLGLHAHVADKVIVGIYSAGLPHMLLVKSAEANVSEGQESIYFASPYELAPGFYWLAYVCGDDATSCCGFACWAGLASTYNAGSLTLPDSIDSPMQTTLAQVPILLVEDQLP